MEGIHRRPLQKGPKHYYRFPGKSIYSGTISDEKQSEESLVRNTWK